MERREGIIKESEQIIEGRIENIESFNRGDWRRVLPQGIKPADIDIFLKNEGGKDVYYWHLIPGLIKNEELREAWEKEREIWP